MPTAKMAFCLEAILGTNKINPTASSGLYWEDKLRADTTVFN